MPGFNPDHERILRDNTQILWTRAGAPGYMERMDRDFAAELRTMPTSQLLILMAYQHDQIAWIGVAQGELVRSDDELRLMRAARVAIKSEIDRRFPVPS